MLQADGVSSGVGFLTKAKQARGRGGAPTLPDTYTNGPLPVVRRSAWLLSGTARVALELALPRPAGACLGWVILPQVGRAAQQTPILAALQRAGFATLTLDLLAPGETADGPWAFNPSNLAPRLVAATRWLAAQPEARGKRLAYLAGGIAAGITLAAASEPGIADLLSAIVSLNGRVDLAAGGLAGVSTPSLLVVNRRDRLVLDANRGAARRLNSSSRLVVAPSFRYLRYALRDPGQLEALLAVEWLSQHTAGLSQHTAGLSQPVAAPDSATPRPSLAALLDSWPAHGRAAAAATVLALLAALGGPSQPALAAGSGVSVVSGVLIYAGSAANSNLTVAEQGSTTVYRLIDTGEITMTVGAGCVNVSGLAGPAADCSGVTSLILDLNDGNDTVKLTLADNFKPTLVDGGTGTDSLTIDDSHTAVNGDTVQLSNSTYDRFFINTITYGGIDSLNVLCEPANNPITIHSTSVPTTLNANGGNDSVVIGSGGLTPTLDGIDGPLTVLGGSGSDSLTIDDRLGGASSIYKSGVAPRAGVAPITWQSANDFETLNILAGLGSDTLDVSGFTGSGTLAGGPGINRVVDSGDSSFTLSDNGNLNNESLTSTSAGNFLMQNILEASLTATGSSDHNLIASGWGVGPATLVGGSGFDNLYAGQGGESLDGGGGGSDWVIGICDSNFQISDTLLSSACNQDTLTNIENAELVGGGSNNQFDVSNWNHFAYLNGGGGGTDRVVDTANSPVSNWQLNNTGLTGGDHGDVGLVNIEQAFLTGSSGNDTISAAGFTLGSVTILAGGGNDSISGGGGNFGDVLDGGTGTDTLFENADTDFTLTNSGLSSPALGSDVLSGIDAASLTGGAGNNKIDASGFTNGPVTLTGNAGNDTLLGGAGNDLLTGGPGNNSISGGPGIDTLVESGGSFALTDTLLSGPGVGIVDPLAGDVEQVSLTGSSGNDSLTADGFTRGPVTLNGGPGGNDTLTGGNGNDLLIGGGGTSQVNLFTNDANNNSFVLTNGSLAVTGRGTDTLTNIQTASLTGGTGNDTLNAQGFSGLVTLSGGAGNDLILGGPGNATLDGGDGIDTLTAQDNTGAGNDSLTLTAAALTRSSGTGAYVLSNFEFASLTGGAGNNLLDASAFTGPVTLSGLGGDDTLLSPAAFPSSLDGGPGTDLTVYNAGNGNVTLSGTSILGSGGNNTLVSIESYLIQGGPGNNIFDASAFGPSATGGGVAMDGGGGDDVLIGSAFNDTLLGGAGNDTIIPNGGNDVVDGGTGTNTVVDSGNLNFTLAPTLLSGSGTYTLTNIEQAVITGGISSNVFNVSTFTGTVALYGLQGNDTFVLGSGGGTVDGGVGNANMISATADSNYTLSDSSLGGLANYSLSSIQLASLTGGNGNNSIDASGFSGNVTLSGQGGNDTLIGGLGNDSIVGGPGDDSLSGGPGANTLTGGGGNDRWIENGNFNISLVPLGLLGEQDDTVMNIGSASLTGGVGDNIINLTGYTGTATIDGGAGNDLLTGGLGDDSLFGNAGNDTLVASPGNDTLNGGDGTDLIYASGNYTFTMTDSRLDRTDITGTVTSHLLNIETGHLVGGDQNNLIDASSFGAAQPGAGQVTLEGLDGNDTLLAAHGDSSLDGGNGSDCLVGGPGNDTLMGGDIDPNATNDKDTLLGNAGNDLLNGGFGPDYLDGGVGNDVLIGASGNDTMIGGPGDDTLSSAFDVAPDGSFGNDLLSGGAGNNVIDGGVGQDTLTETGATNYAFVGTSLVSGQGTDNFTGIEAASLTGGDSPNLFDLTVFTGTVTAVGGLGNDTFFGSQFGDSLDGGQGVNRLVITATASSSNFTLSDASLTGFGALNDTLANIEEASLTGGSGADTLNAAGFSGNATLTGGPGPDSLVGGHGDDCLVGGDANDTLSGGPGLNQIIGGPGANLLVESATGITNSVQFTLTNDNLLGVGTDVVTNTFDILSNTVAASLRGGSGPDLFDFSAFTGTATLDGAAGADTFVGGAGNGSDCIQGGPGVDRLVVSGDINMLLTDNNLNRSDTLGGVLGVDTLTDVEQASLTGGASNNTLNASGFSGPVTLDGGAGDDVLIGGPDTLGLGADILLGGPGNDTLTGGRGNDTLDGGPGVNLLSETGQDVVGVHFILSNNTLTRVDGSGT